MSRDNAFSPGPVLMHPFRPSARARVACRSAFGLHDWLNLDFLAADGATVPLHLSLRPAQDLVVLNRFHAGRWGREVHLPARFGPGPARLELRCGRLGVALRLNGRHLARIDALPRPDRAGRFGLRRGFPGLGRIVALRVGGGMEPGSLRLWGQPAPPPGLTLSDRFEVVWPDPPDPAPDRLEGTGLAPPEPAALLIGPEVGADGAPRRKLVALLPGRAWAEGAAEVRLGFAGSPPLRLTRDALRARIERAARAPLWPQDRAAALQAVELARHARLLPELSATAADALRQVAAEAGLGAWLAEGGGAPPPPPALAPDPVQARLDEARRLTGRALRSGAPEKALDLARAALGESGLGVAGRRAVLLGLVEGFVHAEALAQLAGLPQAAALLPIPPGGDAWALSSAAALDAQAERWTSLAARIDGLTAGAPGWIVTPALGWAVARAATPSDRAPDPAARAQVLRAFLRWADRLAGDYQGRAPCVGLVGAMAAILRHADLMPPDLRDWANWTAQRVWGLSPRFWAALGPEMPDPLRPAAQIAASLFAEAVRDRPDRTRLDELLTRAHTLGMAEAGRFRYELLGPSGLPDHVPDPGAAAARGLDPGEACLRALLHPEPAPAPPEAVATATAHLRKTWRGASEGALAALERRLIAHAQALPADPPPDLMRAWQAEARHLGPVGAALIRARERGMGALQDTLVCIYSCQSHLDTRLPLLRATWLADLERAGIPWLAFVGGGDGTCHERIVRLPAPDDYDGLPAKTLAMLRWVRDRTSHARLLKVDDDCFVDVAAMFGDAALLRHPYLGRPLTRVPGQHDRTWHMSRAATGRGRLTPDKSPEPARYADGGTGYVLSRGAVTAVLDAAASPEGQRLCLISALEDKLVGDLAALAGIPLSGEDWRCAVWRRPAPGLPSVPAWEVGPLPYAGGPVRLAHLDDPAALPDAARAARDPAPRRGRIWPSFAPVRPGSRTNALDLVSPLARLERVRQAPVTVVAAVRNEAAMLPIFLSHYRRLGVGGFLIADNASDDGTAAILAEAHDVAAFSVETPYAESMFGVAWQQALLATFRCGQWSVIADADELLVLPEGAHDLPGLLEGAQRSGCDGLRVRMLDLYPRGPLSGVTLGSGDPFAETGWADRSAFLRETPVRGPFSDAETLTSALRHRLIPGMRSELFTAQKVAILRYRPWMRLTPGLHHVAEVRLAAQDLVFAHFKYTAAFRAKAEAEVRRKQHFNGAEEYRAYLSLLAEGRDELWDPDHSVPWREALVG